MVSGAGRAVAGTGLAPSASALALAVALAVAASLSVSCAGGGPAGDDLRLDVVASAYPLAEAAERVGGDGVRVENLAPPGAEPHDLELAPDHLEELLTADVVLFVGGDFQPAVQDAVAEAEGVVVDALEGVHPLSPSGTEPDTRDGVDPHVWLDPARFAAIVERIADVLAEVDPANAATYRANAEAFSRALTALDVEFRDGLASCSSRTIVVSHAAFGYLADAYDLTQEAISGISPEAEPDPARLAELKELVEARGVTTVFTEELTSPEVAETLAAEAGVTTAVLNPLEGLTRTQLDAGEDYGSVMRRNLETLRGALGCA